MSDVEALLRTVPIFAELDEQSLAELSAKCRRSVHKRNTVLMTEGESGDTLFIIESGSAKVYVSDDSGEEMVLYIKDAGEYIGDLALLDNEPRSASVATLEKTIVYRVSKPDFLAILRNNPEMCISIIHSLTHRLRNETANVRSLALENVYQRLVSKLNGLCVEADDGARIMPRRFSHQELSSMIGSSREMVSKILADLTKGGYVEMRDNRITICKNLPRDW